MISLCLKASARLKSPAKPNVDQDAIEATCDKGVLTIRLPKRKVDAPDSQVRKVDVT